MKAGIFLDMENLYRNGGWGLQFDMIKKLVEAQGGVLIRANAYMALNRTRERGDSEYRLKKLQYRDRVRRSGFHVVLKEVQEYTDEDGNLVLKADADLDLAVDALLQSDNLDYVLLGTGDGDFLRLVRALQSRGKRVDILSFSNTSTELRREADYHFNGYLFPGLTSQQRSKEFRKRGFLHAAIEDQGYGFLTMQRSLRYDDFDQNVFVHITDVVDSKGEKLSNEQFGRLRYSQDILEFEIVAEGPRMKAVRVQVLDETQLIGRPTYPPRDLGAPPREQGHTPREPGSPSRDQGYSSRTQEYAPRDPGSPAREPASPPREEDEWSTEGLSRSAQDP